MKNLFVLLAASLLFATCAPNDPESLQGDSFPLQASIDGDAYNRCPAQSVVLTAFVQNAESVQWRRDGVVIEGQTSRTLTVTESGGYTAAGVNGLGTGPASAVQQVTVYGCTTTLAGNEQNRCPEETVTLIASAHGASTFEWRKDGAVIEGHTAFTLIVHESGEYTAAAVFGGRVEAASDPIRVTIDQCLFVDTITGEWDVSERMIWYGDTYNNKHIVTFEKVDDTTVRIHNFTGDNLTGQVLTASVDNTARTITIDYQEILTREADATYSTYLASLQYTFPGDNIGVGIGTLTAEGYGKGMTFAFPSPRKVGDRSGNSYNGTWQVIATTTANQTYMGQTIVGVETVWTKK